VFCVDYQKNYLRATRRGKGEQQSTIYALDVRAGKVLWQAPVKTPEDNMDKKARKRLPPLTPRLAYSEENDILLLTATRSTLGAYKGKTGDLLWSENIPCRDRGGNYSGSEPPIVHPVMLITHAGECYELQTGSRLSRLWIGMNTNYMGGGTRGCNRALGSYFMVMFRDASAAYVDMKTRLRYHFRGIRSGCTNNLLPAGGILNAPNLSHGCACNWPLWGSFALMHMPEVTSWDPEGMVGEEEF
ncbi:unnamed protein product, partial [marine sediment metagenome]